MNMIKTWQKIGLVLVLAFLAASLYALYWKVEPIADADAYDAIATNMVSGNGYVERTDIPFIEDSAIGRVGPGYQYFLFTIYSVFGHHFEIVWLIQALLHALTGGLIFFIAVQLWKKEGRTIGLFAAVLYLFFIDVLQMPAMLLTESLYLFLLTLTVLFFIRFYSEPTKYNAMLFGLSAALAILTRPTSLLVFAAGLILALSGRRFSASIIMVAALIILIGPWTARNYVIYHKIIPTTAAGGYDLWVGNNVNADTGLHPSQGITDYLMKNGIVAADEKGKAETKNFILGHPFLFSKLIVLKSVAYFSPDRPLAFWSYMTGTRQRIIMVYSSFWFFGLLSLALAGAYLIWRREGAIGKWMIVLALTAPLAVIPIVVETRYRLPIYPFLAIFAGYFFAKVVYKIKETGQAGLGRILKPFMISVPLVCLIGIVDGLMNLHLILSRLGF